MIQEARQAWISSSDGALRPPTVPGMFLDAREPIHEGTLAATYRGARDCAAPGASPTCRYETAETGERYHIYGGSMSFTKAVPGAPSYPA